MRVTSFIEDYNDRPCLVSLEIETRNAMFKFGIPANNDNIIQFYLLFHTTGGWGLRAVVFKSCLLGKSEIADSNPTLAHSSFEEKKFRKD